MIQKCLTLHSDAQDFTVNVLRNEFHFILTRYVRFFRDVLKNAAV